MGSGRFVMHFAAGCLDLAGRHFTVRTILLTE